MFCYIFVPLSFAKIVWFRFHYIRGESQGSCIKIQTMGWTWGHFLVPFILIWYRYYDNFEISIIKIRLEINFSHFVTVRNNNNIKTNGNSVIWNHICNIRYTRITDTIQINTSNYISVILYQFKCKNAIDKV